MSVRTLLEERLTAALSPERLEVIDESHQHVGHAGYRPGGNTHFRVRIVAPAFAEANRVERHRMVNAAAKDAFDQGLHALAIEASAPGEATRW